MPEKEYGLKDFSFIQGFAGQQPSVLEIFSDNMAVFWKFYTDFTGELHIRFLEAKRHFKICSYLV